MEFKELLMLFLTTPETAQPIIKATIDKYKPIIYSVCGELFSIYEDMVNNDNTYATIAKDKWKMFSAYVNAGFSESQAMALIINSNLNRIELSREVRGISNTLN